MLRRERSEMPHARFGISNGYGGTGFKGQLYPNSGHRVFSRFYEYTP